MIKKRSFAYFDYKNIYQESKKLEGGESLEAVSSITGTWSAVTLTPVPARGAACSAGSGLRGLSNPASLGESEVEGPAADRSRGHRRSLTRETFT